MKIGFDARMLKNSGIGTTIQGFLSALDKEQLATMKVFTSDKDFFVPDAEIISVDYPIYSIRQHWAYAGFLKKQNLDLYHMPHFDIPYFYQGKFIVTIHDLIHYKFPQFSTKPFSRLYSSVLLSHISKNAQKIIVVSNSTKKDLEEHFPEAKGKIVVIYPAADQMFQKMDLIDVRRVLGKYQLEQGYLLYVGNLRPSKNTENLLKAYVEVRRILSIAPPLVLVGKNFYKGLKVQEFHPDIMVIGSVPSEDLVGLYNGASLFVFPSLYEGFGLPPLEAMACGAPTLVSRIASLPEVCGDAAEYIDGFDWRDIAQKIVFLLKVEQRRKELSQKSISHAKKYSWKKFSDETWNVYREVLQI